MTDGDLKLIRNLDTQGVALYDLKVDPGERTDIAASRPQDVQRLNALLDTRLGTQQVVQDPIGLPDDVDPATKDRLRELGYIE